MAKIYQNLLTDFGFKFIFGREKYLVHFLNELFQGIEKIKKAKPLRSEFLGKTEKERRAIFDIYCENEKGEKILLEMQNLYQTYFLDQSIYYSSYLIQKQGKKGEWDFHLNKMYIIGILNFVPAEMKYNDDYIYRVRLCDVKTNTVISEKLNFIFVPLPKFNKKPSELKTLIDYWLYVLVHSKKKQKMLDESALKENKFFAELLDEIKLEKLNEEEMKTYKTSEAYYKEIVRIYGSGHFKDGQEKGMRIGFRQGVQQGRLEGVREGMDKGRQEGRLEGVREGMDKGRQEAALNALRRGRSAEEVSDFIGLPLAEVEMLQKQSK